jgi:CRP-like cAMP-binding protein
LTCGRRPEALEDTVLLHLEAGALLELLADHPDVVLAIARVLCRQIRRRMAQVR